MRIRFLTIALLVACMAAADQMPIGQWRTHLAYNSVTKIAIVDDKVFGVSDGALFSVSKSDGELKTYSKITGLNDNNIVNIGYSSSRKTLLIAYANANLDLMIGDEILNIPDIQQRSMTADKTVNDILFMDEFAYLACNFGIVKVNLARREVTDTYIIGPNATTVPVLSLSVLDGNFYATTADNIYEAATTGSNLLNYANWHALSSVPEATAGVFLKTVTFNNTLYLLTTTGNVHRMQTGFWQTNVYQNAAQINAYDGLLMISSASSVYFTDGTTTGTIPMENAQMALYDSATRMVWMAANEAGITRCSLSGGTINYFKPNGPAVNMAWKMRYSDGKIIAVPGGRWATEMLRPANVMMFENGGWTNITQWEIISATIPTLAALDFVDVIMDPADNSHFFAASYGQGVYEFRNNKPFLLYNNDNSGVESVFPLQKPNPAYYDYHRTDGFAYDSNNRLWFLNPMTPRVVKYFEPDPDGAGPLISNVVGLSFADLTSSSTVGEILIWSKNENMKLVTIPRLTGNSNTAMFAFNDNGTPADGRDDTFLMRTDFTDQDEKKVAPTNFRCMVEDEDGTIWVGHTSGIMLLNNLTNFFNYNYRCSRIKVARNDGTNLADLLLDNIQVNSIGVDGANRKWIATETSGVYLVSPDGLTTIRHFTAENSPLLSDNVTSLVINKKTGEVFFGTDKGIISYQSDAIDGGDRFENVHAFPNPVRETYSGPITITGLVADTRVKITDINGNLVYETISNGGVATWDGTRRGGERVATGIYLAICVSKDGKQSAITKILFIN